jgi:3-oxoadipate enol-lactonase
MSTVATGRSVGNAIPLPWRTVGALTVALLVCGGCTPGPLRGSAAAPRGSGAVGASTALQEPIPRRTGTLTVDDGTPIYWELSGNRGPALVLIHGLGGNHAVWHRQVAALARDHRVLVYSQRGFAPSGGDRDRYEVDRLVSDLTALLDDLGIDRASIVGQSMGGWTALAAAITHPERCSAVVLADTLGGIVDEEIQAHYRAMTERARALGTTPSALGVHPALDPDFSRHHAAAALLYQQLASFGSPPPGVIAGQLAEARIDPLRLATLRVPVLFVFGERDRIFPPSVIRRAAGYVPDATTVEIPDCGHSPYYERPAAWRRAVVPFLVRVQAAGS